MSSVFRSNRRLIWETAQRVTIGRHVTQEEIVSAEERFSKVWYGSGETDFSFYSEPDYVYLLLNSWSVRSGQDTEFIIRKGLLIEPRVVIDFHGGMGLTAMLLAMAFPEATVISHAAVKQHREWCRQIAKELGLPNVMACSELVPADLLVAQETMEHFQRPFLEMERLLDTVRPRQYLDGTSFSIDSPGHFTTFLDGEEEVPKKKARRRLTRLLRARGYDPYWKRRRDVPMPFNGRPALFDGPGEFMP